MWRKKTKDKKKEEVVRGGRGIVFSYIILLFGRVCLLALGSVRPRSVKSSFRCILPCFSFFTSPLPPLSIRGQWAITVCCWLPPLGLGSCRFPWERLSRPSARLPVRPFSPVVVVIIVVVYISFRWWKKRFRPRPRFLLRVINWVFFFSLQILIFLSPVVLFLHLQSTPRPFVELWTPSVSAQWLLASSRVPKRKRDTFSLSSSSAHFSTANFLFLKNGQLRHCRILPRPFRVHHGRDGFHGQSARREALACLSYCQDALPAHATKGR